MNDINFVDQFPNNRNYQRKTDWGLQIKREDDGYNMYPNFYSFSPSQQQQQQQQERQGYYKQDVKPNIEKSLQHPCIANQQRSMEAKFFYPPGGNHQVPGEDDSMNYDSNSNEFYEMPKHTPSGQILHTDEMYQQPQNAYGNSHLPIPISECSANSLPIPLTPFSIPTTGSAPTSPSIGYELEVGRSRQYMPSATSPVYQDSIVSPFASQYPSDGSFIYDDAMQMTPRGSMRDPKYCERRRKNNEASKKSRAKKKEKAKEMETRAQILEEENRQLRQKASDLEQDVAGYKQLIDKIKSTDHMECNASVIQAFQQRKSDLAAISPQIPD